MDDMPVLLLNSMNESMNEAKISSSNRKLPHLLDKILGYTLNYKCILYFVKYHTQSKLHLIIRLQVHFDWEW